MGIARHMPTDELQRYLFGDSQHQLQMQVGAWLAESPRFRVFVEAHCDKIRKKVRIMNDEEARAGCTQSRCESTLHRKWHRLTIRGRVCERPYIRRIVCDSVDATDQ